MKSYSTWSCVLLVVNATPDDLEHYNNHQNRRTRYHTTQSSVTPDVDCQPLARVSVTDKRNLDLQARTAEGRCQARARGLQ